MIIATRETFGADLSGDMKWQGGVLGPDGKIYGIPYNATDILIIDPQTGTAARSSLGASLSDYYKWWGGVLGPDGKIYGIPREATDILIIDPVAGTATRSDMGASLQGNIKWQGGVLGPDGKIYGIPYNATDILIIDPVAGTATRSDMGASLPVSPNSKWQGGVLGPDGKIYGIPYNATDILIIDPVAGTATRSDMGASLTGSLKWSNGVLGPDEKIYGVPFNAIDILIIDPVAGTATRSDMGASLQGSAKWSDGVLGPDEKIYGVPFNATGILIIDPVAGTATMWNMGAVLIGTEKWRGGVAGPGGRVYGIPYNATDVFVIASEYILSGTSVTATTGYGRIRPYLVFIAGTSVTESTGTGHIGVSISLHGSSVTLTTGAGAAAIRDATNEVLETMQLVRRLPSTYTKNPASVLFRLFRIVGTECESLRKALLTTERYRDIDQAEGVTLDRIGSNVRQPRGLLNDVLYRAVIKAKVASQLSPGDLDSIKRIVAAMLGIDVTEVRVKALWRADPPEPAAVEIAAPLHALAKYQLSPERWSALMQLVVAAGVRAAVLLQGTFQLSSLPDESQYDSGKGMSNLEQTTGGRLGAYYDAPSPDLPIER